MKHDDDFDMDYQTKYPVTETPDLNAKKLPHLPVRKIMIASMIILAVFFGYKYFNYQKEAIETYNKNAANAAVAEPVAEIITNDVGTQSNVEKPIVDERKIIVGTTYQRFYANFINNYVGYISSLSFPDGFNNPGLKSGAEPINFQTAQQKYLAVEASFLNFEKSGVDVSTLVGSEKMAYDEIKAWKPFWDFVFEKSSNGKDVIDINISLSQPTYNFEGKTEAEKRNFLKSEYDHDLRIKVCNIFSEKIKAVNLGETCSNL